MSLLKHAFKKSFQSYFNSVKDACTEIADRDNFLYALQRIQRGKKDGELCLARIYEQGNSLVHQDQACAYALYVIAAEKGFKQARKHIDTLGSLLKTEDLKRAQTAILKLKNRTLH